jgi:hypothetical protein
MAAPPIHQIEDDLQEGTALMVLDFGQNYPCFYQDEAQQAHWFHHQVTVHPIVAYHRDSEGTLHKEELIFLSPGVSHDAVAVHTFTEMAINHLKDKGVATSTTTKGKIQHK